MQNYLMLNDFTGKGVLKAIEVCGIDVESRVEKIEEDQLYQLHYDPDFHCLRVAKLVTYGAMWPNNAMSMELCPIDIFVKHLNPSKSGELFK